MAFGGAKKGQAAVGSAQGALSGERIRLVEVHGEG